MKRWTWVAVAALAALIAVAPIAAQAARETMTRPGQIAPQVNSTQVAEAHPGSIFQRFRKKRVSSANPFARQVVEVSYSQPAGTIIVDTGNHFLYLLMGDGQALRYGIGVARAGFEWGGTHRITNKREWPGWTPPAAMRKRVPGLPAYMPGGPNNPLGARALYIGSTLYRIHGTNEPWSIGQNVSSGCIRMLNDDVIDLYERVRVGAKVIVM
jgi:lipoprotein-anchoring transpeptidase ErfK/SrfK